MKEIVLITGANGMLAKSLAKELDSRYTIKFLTREVTGPNEFKWDIEENSIDPEGLKDVNHIIHLAGSSIAERRWSRRRKREIYTSRVDSAKLILAELQKSNQTIDTFISASATGYYGSRTTDDILTEECPNGDDFLSDVCREWENVAHSFKSNNVANNISIVRFGIILERNGGALKKMLPSIRLGLGSGIGTGKQWVPWIHISDLCGMLKFILNKEVSGTYNAVSPEHVTNIELTRKLATALKRKIILPNIPPFFFRIFFGEMAVVLLTGSRVSSAKIIRRGYNFKYSHINAALSNLNIRMSLKSLIVGIILTSQLGFVSAQTSTIKGRVFNSINNEAVPFANIFVDSTTVGATSDIEGNYRIANLKPGTYSVVCSFIGFKRQISFEVPVTSARTTTLDFALVEESTTLNQVVITASPFNKREESPVSLRTISSSEIYRNPGGNRDISNVIQILPGVASSSSFRNDIIVRGGAPNENRFYLDGIEVPNINHFATQGSSGGPVGMINVNFIREVDFYAGAFPANRGNALSSIMEFKQIEGNDESLKGTFMIGSSDVGITLDGPIGKKSTFILSARRSYLQLLFKALGLPFLPTYNDFQYKQTIKVDDKNRITLIGLGAVDDFTLNTNANDAIDDEDLIRRNNYILRNLPINTQWNYTIGANWKHFASNSYQNIVVSRNHLNNRAVKYLDNIEQPDLLLLDYKSQEIENKLRIENTLRKNGWKLNMGLGYENATYTNSTYNKIEVDGQVSVVDFSSSLPINKFSVFSHISKEFAKNKLMLSFGLRMDCNDYSEEMINPFDQISPRVSASYSITEKLNANFNIGRYFQLPPYTIMGYRDSNSTLANKENNITYIQSDHFIAGLEFNPTMLSKVTVEGFYKNYDNYPFLTRDSISLANLGGDFGVIGNEPVTSTSFGRSYGLELLVQQKLLSSIYGILSYTFVRGEFSDKNEELVASSWDNRHILNITAGKKFKNDWELGMKFRFVGGAPYTPYDVERSATIDVWDVIQQGVFDWDRLNELRNPASHGLDIRIDKKWYFKQWAINAYIDIQNIYNFQAVGQPYLDVERDELGNPVIDPNNPLAYEISEIENTSGTLLPSIGLMIDF